jgi:hypothetical protein
MTEVHLANREAESGIIISSFRRMAQDITAKRPRSGLPEASK